MSLLMIVCTPLTCETWYNKKQNRTYETHSSFVAVYFLSLTNPRSSLCFRSFMNSVSFWNVRRVVCFSACSGKRCVFRCCSTSWTVLRFTWNVAVVLPHGKVRQLGRLTRLVSGKLFHDLGSALTMDFMFTRNYFLCSVCSWHLGLVPYSGLWWIRCA